MPRYLDPDPELILEDVNEKTNPKYHALNRAVAGLVSQHTMTQLTKQIEDQNIVSFLPLDVQVEDSVNTIMSHIDNMMQYGEEEEPKMPKDMDEGDFDTDIQIQRYIVVQPYASYNSTSYHKNESKQQD